MSTEINLNYL